MSNNTIAGNSVIETLLQKKTNSVKTELKRIIEGQIEWLEASKTKTFNLAFDNEESRWTLTSHFKYQATIRETLNEMKSTYVEWFGEEWDYVAPAISVEQPKKKAGRPKKK
jgi:hypothetical protein